MKKLLKISLSSLLLFTLLNAEEIKKEIKEDAKTSMDSKEIKSKINNLVEKTNSKRPKKENPKKEISKEEERFQKMENMLKEKIEEHDFLETKDERGSLKSKEEVLNLLLPKPIRSVSIGNKTILFASIKEKELEENPSTEKNIAINKTIEFKASDIKYKERVIRIKKGDVFNNWKIKKINSDSIIYENINNLDKKEIKRYY